MSTSNPVKIKVGNEEILVTVPEAPSVLPNELKSKWRTEYINAYKAAAEDNSRAASDRPQFALQEANRILRVPRVESAEEAQKLPAWQCLERKTVEERGKRILKVVTIEGRKYSFELGAAKGGQVAAGNNGQGGQQSGGGATPPGA